MTAPNKNSAGVVLEVKHDTQPPYNKFLFAWDLIDVVRWIEGDIKTRTLKRQTLNVPQMFALRGGKEVWIGNFRFKLLTRPFSEFAGLESFKHS